MKSIVFTEEPSEIKSIINSGYDIDVLIIVALSIRVQAYLKKNNIPFQKTLSFFDNDSHEKCLKHSNKLVVSIENNFNYFFTK